MGVVVRARDEAASIERCVASVRRSLAAAGCTHATVVVAADGCADHTAAVARHALGRWGTVVATTAGNVGAARRVAADHALADLAGRTPHRAAERTWLLSTDADTVVPVGWVAAHLRLADAGAAGVAGIVEVDAFVEHEPGVAEAFARVYALHGDGTHPHVHGANLGVRADAYRSVGGWPPLDTAEDHAFWRRLQHAGWPTVSSIDPWVTTSGRRHGQAPSGFAGRLASLAPVIDLVGLAASPEVPFGTIDRPERTPDHPEATTATLRDGLASGMDVGSTQNAVVALDPA